MAQRVKKKKSTFNTRDPGTNPRSERSPEEGNGNPLQHACLENPMDRGAWWATVHRVTKSQIQLKVTEGVHTHTHTHTHTRVSLISSMPPQSPWLPSNKGKTEGHKKLCSSLQGNRKSLLEFLTGLEC